MKQAERDAGTRHDGGLTTEERRELAELRRKNRRLREDVEILKRATAFFVSNAIARPFSWKFTRADLHDLLHRIDAHNNAKPNARAA